MVTKLFLGVAINFRQVGLKQLFVSEPWGSVYEVHQTSSIVCVAPKMGSL